MDVIWKFGMDRSPFIIMFIILFISIIDNVILMLIVPILRDYILVIIVF